MNNKIYQAIEDEMLMQDWLKGDYDEILTTDIIYDSYKYINSDLYCEECNVFENEKYLMMKGNN